MIKTFEAFSKDSFELPRSNNPIYAIINTSEYNNDGKASVQQAVGLKECDDLGWVSNDIGINLYTHKECELNDLKVGEIMESVEYKGAFIMRIA